MALGFGFWQGMKQKSMLDWTPGRDQDTHCSSKWSGRTRASPPWIWGAWAMMVRSPCTFPIQCVRRHSKNSAWLWTSTRPTTPVITTPRSTSTPFLTSTSRRLPGATPRNSPTRNGFRCISSTREIMPGRCRWMRPMWPNARMGTGGEPRPPGCGFDRFAWHMALSLNEGVPK